MARSSRRERDDSTIASDDIFIQELLRPVAPSAPVRLFRPPRSDWLEIQDNRLWDPAPVNAPLSARAFSGAEAPVGMPQKGVRFSPHLEFAVPQEAIVCAKRKERREVLFAKGRGGGGGARRRRFNELSKVRC